MKKSTFWADFKKFISKGNIIDLAVAVVVGAAFTAIVTALTSNIITPFINWIISLCIGSNGLESAYTILSPSYNADGTLNLAASIYIDWGAFISAIINFFIIAFVIFTILRVMTKSESMIKSSIHAYPTKAERKVLKAQGVNMKDHKELLAKTKELREANKPKEEPKPPTQEELLTQILDELKKQNKELDLPKEENVKAEEKTESKEK